MGQSGRVLAIREGLIPIVDLGTQLGFRKWTHKGDQSLLLMKTTPDVGGHGGPSL